MESGKTVIGTWAVVPSPVVTDIIASSGVDFIVIDLEHGPTSFETAQTMIIACESRQVSPLIRVPGLAQADILKALDIGAHGLHIPNVATRKEAREAVEFAKYPPLGVRGFSPFTRAGDYSVKNAKKLTSVANGSVLVGIHLEGKEAVENVDEILEIEGLDLIFIGLFDISKSLGIPGDVGNPKVIELLKTLTKKINKAGRYAGTIATDRETMKEFIDYGVKYITYSVDCDMIRRSYGEVLGAR